MKLDRDRNADDRPGPDDLLIRPAISSDAGDFYELARLAGAGFTSLPVNGELLEERLAAAERAFQGQPGVLMLALEDRRSTTVIGCAAVKPGGKKREDFLNFQIRNDGQTLVPTSYYDDMTEVGSLLLHPVYRAHGVGPWLARSRYLLIATEPDRFGEWIFSELRGVVDEDDRSPFYDGVCARYFGCSFADADELCAHGLQADLNLLLPDHPIALDELSADARDAMGQPHQAGRRALDYLKSEGFLFEGIVDLLDGGPAVAAKTRQVKTIRSTVKLPLRAGPVDDRVGRAAYLSVGDGLEFRCCMSLAMTESGELVCPPRSLARLEASEGTIAHVCFVDGDTGRLAAGGDAASSLVPEETFPPLDAVSD